MSYTDTFTTLTDKNALRGMMQVAPVSYKALNQKMLHCVYDGV